MTSFSFEYFTRECAMYFYKNLYVDETIKNRRRVCWNLKHNRGQLSIYVISVAYGNDLFDIFHCATLKQKGYPREKLCVMGIAASYEAAVKLCAQMVQDLSARFGTYQFKSLFLEEERANFHR